MIQRSWSGPGGAGKPTVRKPILPPAYLLGGACGMVALHFFLPAARILSFPWTLAGFIPVVIGAVLNVAADHAFTLRETTVKPFGMPSSLVTDGVFTVSRNPMYLGMGLILLGLALVLGTLTPFLVCAGFVVLVHYRFVLHEERTLADRFPAEWRSYSARVRRWI